MTPAIFHSVKRSVIEIIETHKWVLPEAQRTGRPRLVEWIDAIAFGIYKQTSTRATKKSVWSDFKETIGCAYSTFVTALNDAGAIVLKILTALMQLNQKHAHIVKYTDATDIPVCLNKNATRNKTMEGLATWGHSGKGFYFGLKMTMTRDAERRLLNLRFSSANENDREIFRSINKNIGGAIVADAGYVNKEMEKEMSVPGRLILIKPYKTMKRIATAWQMALYNGRFDIEFDFRNLKLFHGLVTSLPRSQNGMATNYLFALLSFVVSK
jgi:Transposase DDE domain